MAQHIDIDEMMAEIERLKEETNIGISEYSKGEENGRMEVLNSLASFLTGSREIDDEKIWKELVALFKEVRGDYWHDLLVADILAWLEKRKKPNPAERSEQKVDLKKEIKEWTDLMVGATFLEQDGDFISVEDYRSVIRQTAIHFLDINARKEDTYTKN